MKPLMKHRDDDISAAAKDLVSAWKAVVRREAVTGMQSQSTSGVDRERSVSLSVQGEDGERQSKLDSQRRSGSFQASLSEFSLASADNVVSVTAMSAMPTQSDARAGPSQSERSGRENESTRRDSAVTVELGIQDKDRIITGDVVRDKVRMNLVKALEKALSEGATGNAIDIAISIENALFSTHKGVNTSYKSKFRQLHFNLKDDKNPDLRRRVLEGHLDPDVLLTLAPEELASDAKREENERIRKEKLFHSAPSAATQMVSDGMFQCFKCRQKKVTYYQMQTRSADEPMTTFLTCLNCGNKWKIC